MPNCGNQIKFFKELSYHKSLTERSATPATLGRAGTGLGLGSKARACRWARNFFTWKKTCKLFRKVDWAKCDINLIAKLNKMLKIIRTNRAR